MSLQVEDGTGLTDADSYLSVADADTYHANRGNDGWTGDTTAKEIALRNATQFLDANYRWVGNIYSTTQSLNFPRTGVKDYNGRVLDYTVPTQIKSATAELALASLSGTLLPITTKDDYVKREKVASAVEVEYKDSAPVGREYSFVSMILQGLYSSQNDGNNVSLTRA